MSYQTTPTGRPVNVAYLVVGLVFLGISGVWALVTSGVVDDHQLTWLLPLTLVIAGLIGLVAIGARGLTRRGGATRIDDTDSADVADLEADAYAPYPRDEERTRILTDEQHTDEGEHR
jgi:hypothetical protein